MTLRQAPSTDLTTFTVEADGAALPGEFQLEYMDIRRAANRIASAELAFLDGDPAEQRFELSSTDQMRPGVKIEIKLGYNNDETTVFKGVLLRQQLKVKPSGQSQLLIYCKDAAFAMAQSCRSQHFEDSTDSDAMESVAAVYGLKTEIDSTSASHGEIVQFRQLDWDFIVQRAERNGLYCATDDGVLRIQAPVNNAPVYQLVYGQNVHDLDLQLDARNHYAETQSRGWSAADQAILEQDGSPTTLSSPSNLSATDLAFAAGEPALLMAADGSVSAQVLQSWADAANTRQTLAKVVGVVTVQGIAGLKIGDWVELQGFGERFNGAAWVGGIVHAVSRGTWLTSIQIGMPAGWHSPSDRADPVKTLETRVSALHIGQVVQLGEDPDGEQRIKVKLPTLGDRQEGIWTRVATLDAGRERGWVSLPEIGDEVVVGFFDNDAKQPVLLGALHSSANPAPIEINDDNHEKGWVTRSGMKLVFNDDKVGLNIETPAGNQILLDEDGGSVTIQDQNDNKWVMDSDGVTLTTNGDINMESRGDINIKGTNVSLEAQANLTLKGGAGANLESSGNAVVKGALVQIN